MFDIGWTEMLVIAVVMIVVVGPKDLPKMLRTFGRMTAKMRSMAGDFQKQFNEALREAELDDVKKSVESLKSLNPAGQIRKQLNPLEKAAADVRAGIDQAMKPTPKPSETAALEAVEAEPTKSGPAALPAAAAEAAPATAADPEKTAASSKKPAAGPAKGRGRKAAAEAGITVSDAASAKAAPRKAAPRMKKMSGTPS